MEFGRASRKHTKGTKVPLYFRALFELKKNTDPTPGLILEDFWGRSKGILHNEDPAQLEHATGFRGAESRPTVKTLTYRARTFRMTLVASKLPQIMRQLTIMLRPFTHN